MVVDFAGGEFAEGLDQHILQDCLRETDIRGTECDQCRYGFISRLLTIFLAVLDADVADLHHLAEALIIGQVDPVDATEATVCVLGSHISNGECLILSQIDTDSFFGCLHIGEYLIEEGVLRGGVEPHRDGAVHQPLQVGADRCRTDEVRLSEAEGVLLAVDEQAQHDQLEEVVEPARVSCCEIDLLCLLELSSDDFGGASDNRIFCLFFGVGLLEFLLDLLG